MALCVGSVSYLNAKPLLYGLESDRNVELRLAVPSRLIAGLASGEYDVALLPVIDYQKLEGLRLIPVGGIACNGPTLTVRIFSACPIEAIERLACDTDSHTSVALAQIILNDLLKRRIEIFDFRPDRDDAGRLGINDALLLIGDKVVCEAPTDRPCQIDLGQAWKEQTGLPFVFAAWTARAGVDLGTLPDRLRQARLAGLAHIEEIVREHAISRGWPAELARQYMTQYLQYDLTAAHLEAIALFHQKAWNLGLFAGPVRKLTLGEK